MSNETEAPERIWIGTAYGNDTGVDWSKIRVFQTDVAYVPEALSDAKDKRIEELEAEWEQELAARVTAEARVDELEAKLARAYEAFTRQGDNMAFVLNHMDTKNWYEKLTEELAEDRATLAELKGGA